MKVTNKTSFELLAFGWFLPKGYGDDVRILPGQTVDVSGPYLGEMDGGKCFVHLAGEITCHEGPDDETGLQVGQGSPLSLADGDRGLTVRHHTDMPEPYVLDWRKANPRPKKQSEMVKCPGCDLQLPKDDQTAQIAHMDEKHLDIIAQRRRSAGV